MLCQECGEKPAVVLFTQIANDAKTVLHLCVECAEKRGFSAAELQDKAFSGIEDEPSQHGELVCLKCALSYDDFKQSGRLGCGQCYTAFSEQLEVLLKKVHGSTRHVGKVPSQASGETKVRRDLLHLRQMLREAIKKEEFEEAARLRDKIRLMERTVRNDN
ncbi:MAG TPA: hypothetical protein EYP53_00305 [Candidatus Latescibacteria bacterium]|nr:hypothetical protein [Candidatus Latescibacterota bacterium]